tara:strand:- start:844 stop:1395 length:552 start_codon:yes stop_codon:yes gene_type:complete
MNYITVFGSSRCKSGEPEYIFAEEVGELIGKYGHNVATGGYQGTMEAVSKGALNHGVTVNGVTVPSLFSEKSEKGFERTANIFVNNETKAESLSNRIHFLLKDSKAVIVLPGKIGTMTELFVAWNSNYLFNINENKDLIPIFLKKDFWKKIVDELPNNMELNKEFLNYFENIDELEMYISELN